MGFFDTGHIELGGSWDRAKDIKRKKAIQHLHNVPSLITGRSSESSYVLL